MFGSPPQTYPHQSINRHRQFYCHYENKKTFSYYSVFAQTCPLPSTDVEIQLSLNPINRKINGLRNAFILIFEPHILLSLNFYCFRSFISELLYSPMEKFAQQVVFDRGYLTNWNFYCVKQRAKLSRLGVETASNSFHPSSRSTRISGKRPVTRKSRTERRLSQTAYSHSRPVLVSQLSSALDRFAAIAASRVWEVNVSNSAKAAGRAINPLGRGFSQRLI